MSSDAIREALGARSGEKCELCQGTDALDPVGVAPYDASDEARAVLACGVCRPQLDPAASLEEKHWFCLQSSVWSEVPAVKVLSVRLLQRLGGVAWASDLLEQAYLDDDERGWLEQGRAASPLEKTVDSNGNELNDGDAVTLIKALDVKGANFTAKRGTMVKGIRLTDSPEYVEGRVNGTMIVLKTCFVKKA